MDQSKQKKEWELPELVVLVRSKPEEAVLAVCKTFPGPGGPVSDDGSCMINPVCAMCNVGSGAS